MRKTLALLLLFIMIASVGFASGINDTENHIAYDNDQVEIPSKKTNLTTQDFWIRDEKNLITNFYSMYCPEVVYVPERDNGTDYPYLMYFFAWAYTQENDPQGDYEGFPGGDAIFMARAKALEGPWEIHMGDNEWDTTMDPKLWVPVILPTDTWDSNWHVGDSSVVVQDGVFYMAFSGMGTDIDGIPTHKSGDTDGNSSCIKIATSTDGLNWDVKETPILIWEGEQGYNETANDFATYYGGYQRPSLMFEDGKWKCWFDYACGTYGQRVGYAENEGDILNPEDWERIHVMTRTSAEDWAAFGSRTIRGVDFEVIKIGSTYYAYGDPYLDWYNIRDRDLPNLSAEIDPSGWSRRQITEYQSKNGMDWTVTGYFLPDTGYEANQIPQPFIDHKNNRVCIFYATQRGTKYWHTTYDWRWDNIRFMYKSLDDFESNTTDPDRTPYPLATPTPKPTVTPTATPTVAQTAATPTPAASEPSGDNTILWIALGAQAIVVALIVYFIIRTRARRKR